MRLSDETLYNMNALVEQHYLTCEKHPDTDLYIYNYTPRTQFANLWNAETRMCRGLIIDHEGNVRARPFRKFFNYGQEMPRQNQSIVEATEKMDGSLGVLYRLNGEYCISTRGSFQSEQAQWATIFLNQGSPPVGLDPNLTLLFEIIYPANRIVIDYGGWAGLVLIGAIDMEYGRDYLYRELEVLADQYGYAIPKYYDMQDPNDYLNLAVDLSANNEGFVLRYTDGERYKVKGEQYKIAHKLMTGISFKRVLEAVASGVYEQMIEGLPDEFLTTILGYYNRIADTREEVSARIYDLFGQAPRGSRKEFALWCKANCSDDQGYMFAVLDGKELAPLIYKHEFKKETEEEEQSL